MENLVSYLNVAGKSFFDFGLSMLVQSSVVIAIVLGLDLALRRKVRAVFRYCLWRLGLVKLVLPVSLALPAGVG